MNIHVRGPEVRSPREVLSSRPVRAIACVVCLGLLLEFAPNSWGEWRLFRPHKSEKREEATSALAPLTVGETELTGDSQAHGAMAAPDTKFAPHAELQPSRADAQLAPIPTDPPQVPLLDPTGKSLDSFWRALNKTRRREAGAITRIAHFGDSVVVSDYVTGTLRRKLQSTFGDAGHGYVLIANPWPAYFHNDVFRYATKGFRVSRIVGPLTTDGRYGLGGVTFRAGPGVVARFGTAEKGDYGRNVSRFIVSYLESPGAGSLLLQIDDGPVEEVSTTADVTRVARHEVTVPDGEHRLELKVKGAETRTFGVVLERDEPGVVLDALGVQGARIRFLGKQDEQHYEEELKWRRPDLVVYQFGANESGDGYAYPMDEYLRTMKEVIERQQKALPESSCLIIGAMDRARVEEGLVTSMKIIQLIIAEQRRAAEQLGCAYFDTYGAMGGWGSMPSWVKRGLGQADMTHPTGVGAERIANWIYAALIQRYNEFLESSPPPEPK